MGTVVRVEQLTGRALEYIGSAMLGPWQASPLVRRVRDGGHDHPSRTVDGASTRIYRVCDVGSKTGTSARWRGAINRAEQPKIIPDLTIIV
jgi:hypothetical protein